MSDTTQPADEAASDGTAGCHRRNCDEPATFVAIERYQEETGHGAVEARAELCADHASDESPANLDGSYPEYVFRVEPLARSE